MMGMFTLWVIILYYYVLFLNDNKVIKSIYRSDNSNNNLRVNM